MSAIKERPHSAGALSAEELKQRDYVFCRVRAETFLSSAHRALDEYHRYAAAAAEAIFPFGDLSRKEIVDAD